MTNHVVAMRYARALLKVSRKQDVEPERIEQELSTFIAVIDKHPILRKALSNPVIPPTRKHALVAALVYRIDGLSQITVRLLPLLAERNRFFLLREILEVYRDRLMAHRGVVRAKITTAEPLSSERVKTITRGLEAATGRQVSIESDVDSAVIGGIVTQIGSTVYDGSIARHLARMKQHLLGKV